MSENNLPTVGSPVVADGFGDPQALMVARNWLSAAMQSAGAESYAAGIGCGQADIDIEVGGLKYNVSIRPKQKAISG